ncbi:MAG: hypothetical protein ATN35_03800 [Epulopiscium sp. Nele67-Bin004]|nr:MAG: hypothetical protein ATN35_03800 [Epulopiscium sp. Nele67-Bin004]
MKPLLGEILNTIAKKTKRFSRTSYEELVLNDTSNSKPSDLQTLQNACEFLPVHAGEIFFTWKLKWWGALTGASGIRHISRPPSKGTVGSENASKF